MVTVSIVLLLVLLALGVPVAFSLALTGSIGLIVTHGPDVLLNQLKTIPYRSVASGTLATIPLFILMAEFVNQGGIARQLFDAANKWLGRLPAGVAIATVFSSAGFGAISGSSTAASGTFSRAAIPEFKRLGNGLSAATGLIAVSGTLAVMIPPSVPLVMYGIITENSVGKLLLAGFVPGIMTAIVYSLGLIIWARMDPETLPRGENFSWQEKIKALKEIWGFLVIASSIVISLYSGFATATEIAGIGAGVALVLSLLTKKLNARKIYLALVSTIKTFTMIMTIIVGAMIFSYFLALNKAPQAIVAAIANSGLPPFGILLLIIFLYFVLGCFMDQIAILIITLPLTYPIVRSLGVDPIWYGILVVKMVEIGLVTPPMGLNVYVTSGATGVPVETVFRGTGYMLLFELVALGLLLMFPQIATWLPSLVK